MWSPPLQTASKVKKVFHLISSSFRVQLRLGKDSNVADFDGGGCDFQTGSPRFRHLPLNRSSRCLPTYQHAVSKLGNGVRVLIFNLFSISYALWRTRRSVPTRTIRQNEATSVKASVQTSSASPHSGCGQSAQKKPNSRPE